MVKNILFSCSVAVPPSSSPRAEEGPSLLLLLHARKIRRYTRPSSSPQRITLKDWELLSHEKEEEEEAAEDEHVKKGGTPPQEKEEDSRRQL